MGRFNDTVKVTPLALRHVAQALRKLADIQETQAKSMELAEVPDVEGKNLKSALGALVALGKFTGAATTSFCDKISEEGVSELEGAVLQFRRYLKRGREQLEAAASSSPARSQAAKETAALIFAETQPPPPQPPPPPPPPKKKRAKK
jgi:HAMP domain-containing protein